MNRLPSREQHQRRTGILRLAAAALREQVRDLQWWVSIGDSYADKCAAEAALFSLASHLERVAATGSTAAVEAALGPAVAVIDGPTGPGRAA